MKKTPFTYASRQEIDVDLTCFEGQVPNDLSGFVFINSPVGTVNFETPIPRELPDGGHNQEFGQQIFNGDGLILRFDCDTAGKIRLKTGLLRTPCYYADYNSRIGTKYHDEGLYFKSHGLSRISSLGSRNQVNTSINAFQFENDQHSRLTANFDAGRPFEFDPVSLKLVTPIGYNNQWRIEFSSKLEQVFGLVQSTAHPSFDPETQEFFTVCFQKSAENLILGKKFDKKLSEIKEFVIDKFHNFYENVVKEIKVAENAFFNLIDDFVGHIQKQNDDPKIPDYSKEQAKAMLLKNNDEKKDWFGMQNVVRLMRWKGGDEIDTWNLIDEKGENIVIYQTMHQTSFSKDYIVLVDTSVKFALDIIENRLIPHQDWLNNLFRWITSKALEPTTPLYIVKRADLIKENKNVIARKIILDIETVHFSIEYDNPNDVITMYAAHNSALCAAEWVRHYDTLAINNEPAHENTIGLMICGEMDISRVGKWKINGENSTLISENKVFEKGFDGNDAKNLTKAHTWAVGLCTYQNILSSRKNTNQIPYIFWQFYGLDYRVLTNFIKDLYSNYQNRIIPVDDLLDYNKQGIPFCISRQNTDSMEFVDWYFFKMNQNLRSLQFVPRKTDKVYNSIAEEALDGYILCTMVNGNEDFSGDEYSREVWIFDAADLKKGPICKLHHPDMQFSFTIHSVWIDSCVPASNNYKVDIVLDYMEVLENFEDKDKKEKMLKFMAETVFSNYQMNG